MKSIAINLHGIKSASIGGSVTYTSDDLSGSYRTITLADEQGIMSVIHLHSDNEPVEITMAIPPGEK